MSARAYIRLDPDFAERKDNYPDGAFAALVTLLCAGALHSKRGAFKNERLVRVLLGRRARWLRFLVDNGDVDLRPDGTLYIDGWEEWQEGDWKVAERMARVRARRLRNRNTTRNNDRHSPSDNDNDYDKDNDSSSVTARSNGAPVPLSAIVPELAGKFGSGRKS